MKKVMLVVFSFVIAGCEYVPQKEFKIKTEDGQIITLLCPVIDKHRSTFIYLIDHECRLVK